MTIRTPITVASNRRIRGAKTRRLRSPAHSLTIRPVANGILQRLVSNAPCNKTRLNAYPSGRPLAGQAGRRAQSPKLSAIQSCQWPMCYTPSVANSHHCRVAIAPDNRVVLFRPRPHRTFTPCPERCAIHCVAKVLLRWCPICLPTIPLSYWDDSLVPTPEA